MLAYYVRIQVVIILLHYSQFNVKAVILIWLIIVEINIGV